MRIPFEGMLAADAYGVAPLVVSAWGNDFTLHAPSTALMRHYTAWTMRVADALHADCRRDVRLGREWGFPTNRPTLVTPGAGGIRTEVFYPPATSAGNAVVINARGARTYVRNDVFQGTRQSPVFERQAVRGLQDGSASTSRVHQYSPIYRIERGPDAPRAGHGLA
jgi:hypothetical protein